jgi:TolA-binding protein
MHDKEISIFTEGLKQAQDEFFIDSIEVFHKLIDAYPDSELADDAIYNIGLCFFQMNQFVKAIEFFNKGINNYPDATISILDGGNEFGKTAAKCYFAIVNCHLAMGNLEKAKENAATIANFSNSYVVVEDKKQSFADLANNAINVYMNNV